MRTRINPEGRLVIAINTTIDLDAYALLRRYSPTLRGHGRFLSRLIYEFQARQEERDRLRRELTAVMDRSHAA